MFSTTTLCSRRICSEAAVAGRRLEQILLCTAVACTHRLVPCDLWDVGDRHADLAASRLARLVWSACVGGALDRASTRTRHAAESLRNPSANQHLDRSVFL